LISTEDAVVAILLKVTCSLRLV